jgi:hypothetical protein
MFIIGIHGLLTFCSSYLYLVNLHRNAQVQDILRRSEAHEGDFFVPDDDEISWAELVRAMALSMSDPIALCSIKCAK